ncbi:MAG: winged helix-turn-helix transcriptional regulator [Magnetococcales bacterium]|nr:winged helix-turn-helix transcriptional regulator [Magnetococcales bacterium]
MDCEYDEINFDQMARCIGAIAHPLRLKIITAIRNQELNVNELVATVGSSQSNISQHLGILREKEILHSKRRANKVYYRLGRCGVEELLLLTNDIFAGQQNRGQQRQPA